MTTILVTHDQEEALEVADRVVVMNQAKIEQAGTPSEVFHNPASEFVMDFLGNVNVFRGRVEAGKAIMNDVPFDFPEFQKSSDGNANVYVRPHELDIERHSNGTPAIKAQIQRINPAGSSAKIFLVLTNGSDIQVDLPLSDSWH